MADAFVWLKIAAVGEDAEVVGADDLVRQARGHVPDHLVGDHVQGTFLQKLFSLKELVYIKYLKLSGLTVQVDLVQSPAAGQSHMAAPNQSRQSNLAPDHIQSKYCSSMC